MLFDFPVSPTNDVIIPFFSGLKIVVFIDTIDCPRVIMTVPYEVDIRTSINHLTIFNFGSATGWPSDVSTNMLKTFLEDMCQLYRGLAFVKSAIFIVEIVWGLIFTYYFFPCNSFFLALIVAVGDVR